MFSCNILVLSLTLLSVTFAYPSIGTVPKPPVRSGSTGSTGSGTGTGTGIGHYGGTTGTGRYADVLRYFL